MVAVALSVGIATIAAVIVPQEELVQPNIVTGLYLGMILGVLSAAVCALAWIAAYRARRPGVRLVIALAATLVAVLALSVLGSPRYDPISDWWSTVVKGAALLSGLAVVSCGLPFGWLAFRRK